MLEVGDDSGPSPGGQRQIHRSRLTVWFGFWLEEVGVTVDEQQPMTPAAPKCQQVAEQDRAVPAEHDRDVAGVKHLAGCIGELVRVIPQPSWVEQLRGGVASRIVGGWSNGAGMSRANRVGKTSIEQCTRKAFNTSRKESQYGGSLDDGVAAHGFILSVR